MTYRDESPIEKAMRLLDHKNREIALSANEWRALVLGLLEIIFEQRRELRLQRIKGESR